MSIRAHGQVRRGQVITTYGPGALIDLPRDSAIVGGLETWPSVKDLEEIVEPRLAWKLQAMTGVVSPRLYAPPRDEDVPGVPPKGIGAFRFPEWFVVQEAASGDQRDRSRRLVHRKQLDDRQKFDGRPVVATRFVRGCPKGHVDDVDWYRFVHGPGSDCKRRLWLDERGTSGDLSDLAIRCECKERRELYEAASLELNPLDTCRGARPWLGRDAKEGCNLPSRLLIRTASNAYFPQVVSVLSLPDHGEEIDTVVRGLWDDLSIVEDPVALGLMKKKPQVAAQLAPYGDSDVLSAIARVRTGGDAERPAKQVELDALLAVPEGFGDDVPVDPDFHARRLPRKIWDGDGALDSVSEVIQVHRLREILALVGFTRFEAVTPDINGEYESDVERAQIHAEPSWFPAVENRGEGIYVGMRADSIRDWLARPSVAARLGGLELGYAKWAEARKITRPFPGGSYVLLHTLSHLLIQSLAMRCGYPASSIRERIYADGGSERYGILLFTGSPDAEGTLGGLVQEARHIAGHLDFAFQMGELCSNDPICAHHEPGTSLENRWLLGAACHGCALVAETSCEMRNDYLDRALVVPVLGLPDASFFHAST